MCSKARWLLASRPETRDFWAVPRTSIERWVPSQAEGRRSRSELIAIVVSLAALSIAALRYSWALQ
jgi:hypothetical protein